MVYLLFIKINRIMKKIRNVTLYQSLLFVGFLNAQSQIVFQPLKSNVGNILGVLAGLLLVFPKAVYQLAKDY